ncbi:serine/threonine protein kinase [bacterium]|nr:serine/threonine protein kinase [bacterium]MBP9808040.1 serine/threonine protein kinase [bacterium]
MTTKLCKTCGKPPLANRAGSVTSYFFQHNYCQCSRTRPSAVAQNQLCTNCGKSLPLGSKVGSFTSFLFKELRCQCPSLVVAKKSSGISSHRTATAQRLTQRKQFTQMRMNASEQPSQLHSQPILPANSIIGGAFRVIRLIGQGGMGVVYLAEQMSLKKQVALKVLAPEFVNEQSWLRFQAEAKTLAALNHATLVKVYDLGIHDRSLPFYSMDYLQGHNLEEILIADGPLPLHQALSIFIEVLGGLAYAHRNGIIHRDLKPSNIMLCTAGSASQVKILDFGISKLVGGGDNLTQSLTSTGEVFGSPYYMSPEQCVGDLVDARSDIYSIGCSLFEVLSGFVPFEGRSSVETVAMHQDREAPRLSEVLVNCDFPSSIELVLAKCLAKLPQDRYQSAKELSLDLERILDGKDVLIYDRVSPVVEQSEVTEASGLPLRLLSLALLLLIGGAALQHKWSNVPSEPRPLLSPSTNSLLIDATKKTEIAEEKSAAADSGYDSFVNIVGDADRSMGNYSGEQGAPKGSQYETAKFSTIKVVNGLRTISFNFPTDVVIGKIYTIVDDPGVDAKGTVDCRLGSRLTFMPSRLIGDYPQYVKRFRPDDLYGVVLYSGGGDDSVLRAVTALPNIEFLSIVANSELTAASVDSFNKFKNLRSFDASSSSLGGSFFASANCWSKLARLYWNCAKTPAPFLKKLQSSPEFKFLRLSASNLNHQDYLLIAKLTRLQHLDLSGNLVAKEDLIALSALDDLTVLRVKGCQIGLDGIPVLKQFKSLADLQILSGGASDSNFAALRRALPKVRIH